MTKKPQLIVYSFNKSTYLYNVINHPNLLCNTFLIWPYNFKTNLKLYQKVTHIT